MDIHSTFKFLFYHFNNLRHDLGEEAHKIRHTIVSDDQHALEIMPSKDWPYFLNLGGIISQNENDVEELKIINDTIENLQICKNYADIYANVGGKLQNYLKNVPDALIQKWKMT